MSEADVTIGGLEPSGFFVLRTPLLPFELFERAGDEGGAGDVASRPDVTDALYLASPSLVDALAGERRAQAVPKLAAYVARAATRATPFGLFAGCTVGRLGSGTRLELGERASYRRHTRLDNDYLFALVTALEADPAARVALQWRPNSSLYRAGGRWRYAEARVDGTLRTYHLVAVDDSPALDQVLAAAAAAAASTAGATGATVDQLAAPLVDDDVDVDEARAFVGELIEAQLLVSELQLRVTGREPLDALIDVLPAGAVASRLADVRTAIARIDAAGPGASPDGCRCIEARLRELPAPVERARLLQVDMIKPAAATLGPRLVGDLARAVDLLHRLWRPPAEADDLTRFRDAFLLRFEDREVPLNEALDEELGVGFGSDPIDDMSSPLLAALDFPREREAPSAWTPRDELLLAKVVDAAGAGLTEVDLDDGEIAALAALTDDRPPLPDAIEVMATVVARSAADVDHGDYRLLIHGASGPPGARLLGRFCHADGELHRLVADHLHREEACRPGVAFAEIVHLPEGRLGNILCRPVLRTYEIPYLGGSGAPLERQLPVNDLLVSVRHDRVVLRSRRLGREIRPRLTTAHNFGHRSLGLYRFLGALQGQGVAHELGWSWGALARSPFLPRVTAGRLILARAQWTLRGRDLVDLPRDRLPRLVVLADGDNHLVCDLDRPLSVEALRRQLKGRDQATLTELLPDAEELCVTGPDGRFTHELVVPFVRTGAAAAPEAPVPAPATVRRRFAPGSEWLYAKLFTGTGTADRVLVDSARPLVERCLGEGLADGWFFVRYGDGGWHVRLRLHGDAAAMLPLLHAAAEPLLADGRLWRVQLDTYEREVERYGGDVGMRLSEAVFRHDSDAALDLLSMLDGDAGLDGRWRLALAGTDRLLDDLGFSLPEKARWAQARRDAFAAEFRADANLRAQLGRRWRAERQSLEDLLGGAGDANHPLAPGLAVLARRSEAIAPLAAELRRQGLPLGDLAASYAHMHANRLLRAGHRAQELVLHDLLARLYRARLHRG
ncbi:MAG TPA: lantibiotic dehydratase [Acidimicrobiales bacterium]